MTDKLDPEDIDNFGGSVYKLGRMYFLVTQTHAGSRNAWENVDQNHQSVCLSLSGPAYITEETSPSKLKRHGVLVSNLRTVLNAVERGV